MQPPVFFGLGSWSSFIIASLLSIYAFNDYEHAWGRGGSFQVEVWVSFLGAFVAMVVFGASSALTSRVQSKSGSFVLGVVSGAMYVALFWVLNRYTSSTGVPTAALLLVAISAIASQLGQKYVG